MIIRGMLPSRHRLLGSGLRGTLVRTKTTGVGKGRETLELVVDRGAFLFRERWLEVGWELWEDTDKKEQRQFPGGPKRGFAVHAHD